jgi:flavin-dependent dehydrogenase
LVRSATAGWDVEAVVRGVPVRYHAELVVDATGRSSALARRLGARKIVQDCLVGLVSFFPGRRAGDNTDRRTLVEAVEDGWWYSALLPGGRYVAAFMTDADLLPRGRGLISAFWKDRHDSAMFTASRLRESACPTTPRVVIAESSCLDRTAGDDWIAVGDAAASVDPLSSQGIYRALVFGVEAARALDRQLQGKRNVLRMYATRAADDYEDHLRRKSAYYGRERRWPNSLFWQRRHTPQAPSI